VARAPSAIRRALRMYPHFPYGCPHVYDDCWYGPWRCTRCILWRGLIDLLASLVLIGIFVFAWVQLR